MQAELRNEEAKLVLLKKMRQSQIQQRADNVVSTPSSGPAISSASSTTTSVANERPANQARNLHAHPERASQFSVLVAMKRLDRMVRPSGRP